MRVALAAAATVVVLALGGCGAPSLVLAPTSASTSGVTDSALPQLPGPPVDAPGGPGASDASTTFDVPGLGISGVSLQPLGLQPDGTVAVPPVSEPMAAGVWVKAHATPETPTVILAHVNGGGRRGLFAHLTNLGIGDEIVVHRGGAATTFRVVRKAEVDKHSFPTRDVWADQPGAPVLRLVTCGGVLDRAAHSYLSNEIVFAVAM